METIIYGLTESDIKLLLTFAMDNDIWGYYSGENTEMDSVIERIANANVLANPEQD